MRRVDAARAMRQRALAGETLRLRGEESSARWAPVDTGDAGQEPERRDRERSAVATGLSVEMQQLTV